MAETDKVTDLEFKWGKKRGVGGKKKEVRFYESFTYDGVEYTLFDCVYMHKEGEPEPYIGKLIKIWENADKTKKVKVQWFFRPSEILRWLEDKTALENEIFFASGAGIGLANVNPLEAIAGKCNVVCISKDSMNQQPSEEELKMADYIFYRTFDVELCTILDKMDDKVGGLGIKFIYNRKESDNASGIPKLGSDRMEVTDNHVKVDERLKSAKDSDALDDRPTKNARIDNSFKSRVDKITNSAQKLLVHGNDVKAMVTTGAANEEKTISGHGKDPLRQDKGEKSAKESGDLENRPSKKVRIDCSVKITEDKNRNNVQKLSVNSDGNNHAKDLVASDTSYDERTKSRLAMDSLGPKSPSKKEKLHDKTRKVSNGKLPKVSASEYAYEDRETEGKVFKVTRRPDADKSKWFRTLPWEERLRNAHEQGKLVLLQNLDPEYTSGEVEDIIWHAFKVGCTAKMVQRTTISSPHSGQAYVIFKTREATERVIRKLNEGCLMLPNGRPLVGSTGPPPNFPGKQSTYFGHLVIDKIKLQVQREMKDAVSTSHCSQPNTVEYDMAMDWCLLQSRSDSWWKRLYKLQGQDLRILKANLESK